MFIAHRTEDGRQQLLLDHLQGTAQRSQRFAEPFGAGRLAYEIGLAHDIGKYSQAFQQRIRGGSLTTDHSTAGAQELSKVCGILAAYCVAGHHSGLPDGGTRFDTPEQGTMSGRLKKQVEPYRAFASELSLSPQAFSPPRVLGQGGFTASFWARMLFSCLVDADFLDTEAFMAGAQPPRGPQAEIDELLIRLERYVAPWWDAKTPLNRARCRILRACMDAGTAQPPGLFTLTVPTGGGKTVSSLAFALHHAKAYGKKRILYVIPYTSIIEQTADIFRDILGYENVLEHHSNVDFDDQRDPDIQRKKLAAENWDMPVIVTTAVQFFESLFANRPSRCRKLHNLVNSVIIFDEAQTIPLPYLQPCVRAIAELTVNYGASCVLCTATQPALTPMFQTLSPELTPREIAPPVNRELFQRIRFSHLGQLSDEELAAKLNGHEQALCIVNTRKQAQAVYQQLDPAGSFHLSTLMTPAHRRQVLCEVRRRLEKKQPCRVVSTSLIEAGVDVDFPIVYRAETGLDSEIQAAGRCNREGARPAEKSIVYLFQPDDAYTIRLPHSLRRPLEVTRQIVREHTELDAPETLQHYFTRLYQFSGDSLDTKAIVSQLESGAEDGSYPFATVARQFQIIDSDTRTVFIPYTDDARHVASQLRDGRRSRALLRRAGQDSVNIYPDHFTALSHQNALEILDESVAILRDLSFYRGDTGLSLAGSPGGGIFV